MNQSLSLNKEQRVKLIKLIHLLDSWEFKKWNDITTETKLFIDTGHLIIVNQKNYEELSFHWYELLTTYLLKDLCDKYIKSSTGQENYIKKRDFFLILEEVYDKRLYLNESQHPVDVVWEHFKQFVKHGEEQKVL